MPQESSDSVDERTLFRDRMPPDSSDSVDASLVWSMRRTSFEAYGWRLMKLWDDDPIAHVEKIRNFPMRDDDVILAAYPKTGSHWLWEVIQMVVKQKTEYETRTREYSYLESVGGLERCQNEASSRVISSHNVFAHLPQQILSKKTKIIHVVRNPKDSLVSLFWNLRNFPNDPELTFEALLDAAIGDRLSLPSQLDYLHQMAEFERENPVHPILHIYYEDMKQRPVQTIKQMSQFLNVPSSEEFCQAVADACSFDKLKHINETGRKKRPAEFDAVMNQMNANLQFYRKGIVGDWKNQFTVSQNERFDEYLATHMKNKQLKFKFIYE